VAGVVANLLGPAAAIWFVAGLTAISGVVVAIRMYETHRQHQPFIDAAWQPLTEEMIDISGQAEPNRLRIIEVGVSTND
jgi:hypothetical protein